MVQGKNMSAAKRFREKIAISCFKNRKDKIIENWEPGKKK